MVTREEFIAGADWRVVRAGVLEHRGDTEARISNRLAEIRAACRPPKLREQEQLAAWQDNIDAASELLAVLDREGV